MVDWNGLFKWSMKYNDGTTESNFKQMTGEDKAFLENAMKSFTFNESQALKDISKKLQTRSELDIVELTDTLEDLQEVLELHEDNAKNFCKIGGYIHLIDIIMSHEDAKIRYKACVIFTLGTQYNAFVQEFGLKHGALKLMNKIYEETEAANRASMMGCISALVKGQNFEGKRVFVAEMKGLEFLAEIIIANSEPECIEVDPKNVLNLLKKSLIFLFDMVGADSVIFKETPNACKIFVLENSALLQRLFVFLGNTDVGNRQLLDLREFTLHTFRILVSYENRLLKEGGLQEVL
jgi:hypothetical protein